MRRLVVLAATAALAVPVALFLPGGATIELPPGADVAAAARRMPGATIRLLPGTHPPFMVEAPVTIEGGEGVAVRGPITIAADHVTLRDLEVLGGDNGVTVDRVDHAVLEGLTIEGAELHGIEVSSGSATVTDCRIAGLVSPFAQGFEVRNSNGHPRTVVEGCTVGGGQEGIVSHVSRVEFRDNAVRGTTMRGVAVTEMSEGIVEGNLVEDAVGTAYYCGDMSHCEIRRNVARGVEADPDPITSRAGFGAVAYYYSTMRAQDNHFQGLAAEPLGVFSGSVLVDRFPLGIWAPGWAGALPGLAWAAGALALVALVRLAVGRWARRPRRPARPLDRGLALHVLLVGFAVQSFHMLEHAVQVFQVYVADAEVQTGIAGSLADAEWVHFTYNFAVLFFMLWAWRAIRPGGVLQGLAAGAGAWFLAAVVVQTYHFAEHTAKIVQHVRLGIDPAPGIIGGAAGLVWFHFAINLAVYAGLAVTMTAVIRRTVIPWASSRLRGLAARLQPEPPISS